MKLSYSSKRHIEEVEEKHESKILIKIKLIPSAPMNASPAPAVSTAVTVMKQISQETRIKIRLQLIVFSRSLISNQSFLFYITKPLSLFFS